MTGRSRRELAEFLRARRERIRPEEVGLPPGGRRRTPGLRREEVAQLAGVGVTWYTWLEQGREINASASVLTAIARALSLDASERDHLLTLAGVPAPDTPPDHGPIGDAEEVTEAILAAMEPNPVDVQSPRSDYLVYNHGIRLLFGDLDALPPERRNVMWLGFTDPHFRTLLVDWEQEIPHAVAQFRRDMAEHVGEPAWERLVADLSAVSPEFRAMWADHRVSEILPKIKRIRHPRAGTLSFLTRSYWMAPRRCARLRVHLPADPETGKAMRELAETDAPLFRDWSGLARTGIA